MIDTEGQGQNFVHGGLAFFYDYGFSQFTDGDNGNGGWNDDRTGLAAHKNTEIRKGDGGAVKIGVRKVLFFYGYVGCPRYKS